MGDLVSRSWVWHLDAPPEALWPILADTARLNEAARLPKYEVQELPQPNGAVMRRGAARIGGMAMEWEERPFEWAQNRRYGHTRIFSKGPLRRFSAYLDLEADGDRTKATYSLQSEPAGWLGRLLLALGLLDRSGKVIERLTREAVGSVTGARPTPYEYSPPDLPPGASARAAVFVARLESGQYGHGLARKLADHVLTAQEVDLLRMRPLRLARLWGVEPRLAIELCLEAARIGMLRLSWDVLCPRCRGAKRSVPTLDQLPRGAHCPSCNIEYDSNFSRNVEVTFQPAPALRVLTIGEFCVNGPGNTPHVVVQQILDPGETRTIDADLSPGRYRLRTLEPGGQIDIDHAGGGFPTLIAEGREVISGRPAAAGTLAFVNRTGQPRTLLIESRDWLRDALTARRVTAMQAFRDLFSDEVVRPDEDVAIDNVTLIFTDLESSTALYERIGDGPAYKLVREHFGYLADKVRLCNGALVKTIGDSVMAAFADPADAVRAALAAQQKVAEFNAGLGGQHLIIKMGVHGGACIAVNLNGRLDYFGTIVNMAARLQGLSGGGEIVLSESLAQDPAVADLLRDYQVGRETAALKGFDAPVPFRRLRYAAILAGGGSRNETAA